MLFTVFLPQSGSQQTTQPFAFPFPAIYNKKASKHKIAKTMPENVQPKKNGSVLVFTLLLLSVALVGALAMATAIVMGTKSASNTNRSVQSFQTAEVGIERVLQALKDTGTSNGTKIANLSVGRACDQGTIVNTGNSQRGAYELTFYDVDKKPLGCENLLASVHTVKSVGKFGGTVRAVETAVAGIGGSGVCGGYTDDSGNKQNKRGCANDSAFDTNTNCAQTGENAAGNNKFFICWQ